MERYEYGNKDASVVLLQPVGDFDVKGIENEVAYIQSKVAKDFQLIAFKVNDWNRDLSPWKAPAVFGKDDFGEGAAKTLAEMMQYCEDKTKTYFLGGYSLAGLFALWAAYQTDWFLGVAAASPSVWFPGFTEYVKEREIKAEHVYLSLGNKEEKTRNQIMATVGDKIRELRDLFSERHVDSILEWNEGNHFREADVRTAKAFAWVLNQSKNET